MSMHNYGCVGYVVKAEQLTKLFALDHQEQFTKLLELEDMEELEAFAFSNLPKTYPTPIFFKFDSDEHESETLENGIYAQYDDSDLFVKTPSPQSIELKKHDINPEYATWVMWG